jgi:hypothetical protein
MTFREKVILGLVGVAAVGAGLHYAFESFAKPDNLTKRKRIDHTALMTTVQVSLQKGELTDREERVLAAATAQWIRNPLREQPLVPANTKSAPQSPLPKYIGYIDTGLKVIAIIDGNDYRPGEPLLGGEFQLLSIYPDHIELLRRGASDPVDVPLEKPQITQQPQ